MTRRPRRALVAPVAVMVLAACTNVGFPVGRPAPAGDATAARAQLSHLVIAPRRDGGYDRARGFGRAWSYDADHNGCRTRDDILRRDMTGVVPATGCTVSAGTLHDPYTGRTIRWTRTRAAEVQVDHLVPLAAAWAHGARDWPQRRRLAFANDDAELIAASARANESKGDGTPEQWRPPRRAEWCAYAVRYVAVATRYELSVSAGDKAALDQMLDTC